MPNVRRRLVALGPPAIVALLGIVTALSVRRERIETEWVMHTQAVRVALSTVFTGLRDAEAGVRGYLLTGDTATLLAYNTQLPTAVRAVGTLRTLTRDNTEQSARIDLLDSLVTAKTAELTAVVAVAKSGRIDSAIDMVRANQQQRLVNRIRTLLGRMDAGEAALLERRLQNVERQRRFVILVVVIGTSWTAGTAPGRVSRPASGVRRPARARRRQTSAAPSGPAREGGTASPRGRAAAGRARPDPYCRAMATRRRSSASM